MILITGGLGFIGVHTTRALLDLGETCLLTQHHDARQPELLVPDLGTRALIEPIDVTDVQSLNAARQRHHVTGIVHLAGAAMGTSDPVDHVKTNITGLLNVIRVAHDWGVDRITVASTMGVYAVAGTGRLSEDMPMPLRGVHAIQACKASFEILDTFLGSVTGVQIINARPSAIWGPLGRTESRFVAAPQLVHAAVRGNAADAAASAYAHYADDAIDMCYVKDCGRAIALLQTADTLKHSAYNVGSGHPTSNADVIAAIRMAVPDANLSLPDGRNPRGPSADSWLDIRRLHDDTGFESAYDVKLGVADYVEWLRAGHER